MKLLDELQDAFAIYDLKRAWKKVDRNNRLLFSDAKFIPMGQRDGKLFFAFIRIFTYPCRGYFLGYKLDNTYETGEYHMGNAPSDKKEIYQVVRSSITSRGKMLLDQGCYFHSTMQGHEQIDVNNDFDLVVEQVVEDYMYQLEHPIPTKMIIDEVVENALLDTVIHHDDYEENNKKFFYDIVRRIKNDNRNHFSMRYLRIIKVVFSHMRYTHYSLKDYFKVISLLFMN